MAMRLTLDRAPFVLAMYIMRTYVVVFLIVVSIYCSDQITADETLFAYGSISRRKRQQQPDDSLFECTSFENCGNSSIPPVALEELTFTDEQRAMCNNDDECLFDLAVTGDEDLATVTLEASEEDAALQIMLSERERLIMYVTYLSSITFFTSGNDPPSIIGELNEVFLVTVGEESIYTFSVNDSNDFNVTVEGGVPDGGVLSDDGNGTYTFAWMLEALPNISGLSFVAIDSVGAASIHSPSLQLCACFNGGECTEEGILNTDESLITLNCLCDEGMCVCKK